MLLTKDSEAWDDIGVSSLVEGCDEDVVLGYHLALVRPYRQWADPSYVFRALQSVGVAYQFHIRAKGVTRYGLSRGGMKDVILPLPPLVDQVAIARFLDVVDEKVSWLVEAKEKLVGLLEELKGSTIAAAVTGQIDVRTGQPYPAYKHSGIKWLGDIPSHWEVVRGKNLWECVDVRSATGEEELLTVSSKRGVLPRSTTTVTMFKAASYVGHKLCWPQDLVINSLWAWAGGLGVTEYHGIISSAYGVYRLRSSRQQDVRYLHELVRSGPFKYELRVRSKGVWTSRLQLTDTAFLNTYISLPPLAEQQAIAEFLSFSTSKINTAIANTRREIELLEEYRARMIADVVTGKLDVREAVDLLEETAA